MKTRIVEKQVVPVVVENNEPIALVYLNANRDRVIYMLTKASEDEIVSLLENNQNQDE